MKRFFSGGIHPSDRKELSAGAVPSVITPPKQVVVPLQQHIGAPCEPQVTVGSRVLRYQKIGDGEGLCVPVHAPVSGVVTAIEPRPHPSGELVTAIVIENDFLDASMPLFPVDSDEPEEILYAIREAGIVGMGGAGFPGNVKALAAMGHTEVLIANACECEPYITADDTLLRACPETVVDGIRILKKLLDPERVVLAVEDNKPEAIGKLRKILAEEPGIEMAVLPARYPQGSEKQLVRAVTGREVPPLKLPAAVGCAVFNVATCAAVCRAVRLGQPLTERIVTVSGEAVVQPQNFLVPIGTGFRDLIVAAGGMEGETVRLIAGGPMMGKTQTELDVPVVKAVNGVLCLLPEEKDGEQGHCCLRCGRCVSVCPMGLLPLYLYRYGQAENREELNRLHLSDCMLCGCCAYICPGRLPLAACFRRGKKLILEANV